VAKICPLKTRYCAQFLLLHIHYQLILHQMSYIAIGSLQSRTQIVREKVDLIEYRDRKVANQYTHLRRQRPRDPLR
jgi:hypothetical protein